MPPDAAGRLAFRPLAADDLPTVAVWLKEPHVARWWGDSVRALQSIADHIGSPTVAPYVVTLDGQPIGYFQSYDIHAEVDHPYQDQPPGSIGIDLSIGEPALIGKGVGPRIVEAFVERLFADGVPRVVIDPHPDNAAAIRAYEKAGFRAVDRRTTIYGPAIIMVRDRGVAEEAVDGAA